MRCVYVFPAVFYSTCFYSTCPLRDYPYLHTLLEVDMHGNNALMLKRGLRERLRGSYDAPSPTADETRNTPTKLVLDELYMISQHMYLYVLDQAF